jgi:aryl-alcohol dehydrogenase-like predicted oxidoreductase
VGKIEDLAKAKNCTASQLALAWVMAQGEDIVPIPGTKRIKYLDENLGSTDIKLSEAELKEIQEALPAVAGDRYAAQSMKAVNL